MVKQRKKPRTPKARGGYKFGDLTREVIGAVRGYRKLKEFNAKNKESNEHFGRHMTPPGAPKHGSDPWR